MAALAALGGEAGLATLIVSFVGEDAGLGDMASGLKGVISGLGDSLKQSASALTGYLVSGLEELVNLGIDAVPYAGIIKGFEGTTTAMGLQTDVMLRSLQDQSKGLITNIELMRNFNQATQLVGADFAQTLPEALGYLTQVSQSTGESMDYLLNSYVLGIARLQPKILDNIGVTVDATEVYEEYAESIGKTAEELTRSEQQMLLMAFTMDTLKKNTEALTYVDMPWLQWTTGAQNFRDAIGLEMKDSVNEFGRVFLRIAEEYGPAFLEFVAKVNDVLEILALVLEAIVFDEFEKLEGIISEEWIQRLQTAREFVLELATAINTFITESIGWENVLMALALVVGVTLILAFLAFLAVLAPVLILIAALAIAFAVFPEALTIVSGIFQILAETVAMFGRALTAAYLATVEFIELGLAALGRAWEALKLKMQEFWTWLTTTFFTALGTLETWLNTKLTTASKALQDAWAELKGGAEELASMISGKLEQAFQSAKDWLETKLTNASQTLKDKWEELKQKASDLATMISGTLSGAFSGILGIISAVAGAIWGVVSAAWAAVTAIGALVSAIAGANATSLITPGGSPSPLERSITGISGATRILTKQDLPALQRAMAMTAPFPGGGTYDQSRSLQQIWNISTTAYDPFDEGRVAAQLAGGI